MDTIIVADIIIVVIVLVAIVVLTGEVEMVIKYSRGDKSIVVVITGECVVFDGHGQSSAFCY